MPTPMPDVSCASMSPVAPIGGPLPSFAPVVSYATQECGADIGATAPSRDMVNSAAQPLIIGRSAPSQRLIQEAALIIYARWRRHLPHDEALEQAARFALHARDIVASAQIADAMVSP